MEKVVESPRSAEIFASFMESQLGLFKSEYISSYSGEESNQTAIVRCVIKLRNLDYMHYRIASI